MGSQLPLGFKLERGHTLENFFAGPNAEVLRELRRTVEERAGAGVLLQGGAGAGKTHLLQALCGACTARGHRVAYLPLRAAGEQFNPSALQGLEKLQHVFLDDVDAIEGRATWECELMERLRSRASGPRSLVLSSTRAGREMEFKLPRLASFVRGCRPLSLRALEGDDRIWALQRHAECRGIKLPEDVARYLMRQVPGDLVDWVRAVDALDYASLANKRRLTKPFIRSVLKPP